MSTKNAQGTLAAVLEVAKRNLGFVEGPNNDNPFAPLVGHANHQPWCASFVAAVFQRAGARLPNTSAYTPTMAGGFKNEERWHSQGRVGDVVFFKWTVNGKRRIAHVGIVESVNEDGSYTCIEGNTDSKGGRTGGRVMRQVRRANIAGFGRPVYKVPTPPKRAVADPELGRGDQGHRVADVQRALVRGGFLKVPRGKREADVVDGDFGAKTTAALVQLQKKHKIKATGRTDSLTWKALRTYR